MVCPEKRYHTRGRVGMPALLEQRTLRSASFVVQACRIHQQLCNARVSRGASTACPEYTRTWVWLLCVAKVAIKGTSASGRQGNEQQRHKMLRLQQSKHLQHGFQTGLLLRDMRKRAQRKCSGFSKEAAASKHQAEQGDQAARKVEAL
eukprot:1156850-Pelagomonas_calceolata.AAC.16